jgi:hypothetical protein
MTTALAKPSRAFKAAMVAGSVMLFAVSGGLLWQIGYNYDGVLGSALTKIHPFTYLLFVLMVWRTLQSGAPVSFLREKLRRRPAAVGLLAVAGLLIVTTILRAGPGMAGFVDTFAGPAIFALLIDDYDENDMRPLVWTVHALMAVNALMGLTEFATHTLFFPYRQDGVAHLEDTRSTALQGHPLLNASLTGVYVISLMAGAKSVPAPLRSLLLLLQMAALVVFGGRTAILVALAFVPIFSLYYLFLSLRRGRVSLPLAAVACATLPLLALGVIVALSSGLADTLLMRFVDDNGSAETRVIMFDMLKPFSLGELLAGPDLEQVESLRRHLGLEQGIENPFIRMTLYQGAILMAVVFASLALFFRELLKGRGARVIGPLIAMAVLLNASESIATKTNFLDKLVLMFVCLFPMLPRAARAVPARARQAPAGLRLATRAPL